MLLDRLSTRINLFLMKVIVISSVASWALYGTHVESTFHLFFFLKMVPSKKKIIHHVPIMSGNWP